MGRGQSGRLIAVFISVVRDRSLNAKLFILKDIGSLEDEPESPGASLWR